MADPNFARTVVYLLEHDESGALGVVLNRPMTIPVAEHFEALVPLVSYPPVFFEGGPVASGSVVAVGSATGGKPELVDIDALGAKDAVVPDHLRLFAGYSGWSAGQLDEELLTGSWIVASARRDDLGGDDIFGANPADLWRTVLKRQPHPVSQMAFYPDDLLVN
ncbi:MAG: YqgE/AlgH family protein [Acidimicrobiales bacterium]